MRKSLVFLLVSASAMGAATAQNIKAVTAGYYELTRTAFNADRAYNTVSFVEKRFRIAGNKGFDESIRNVEETLKKAGYVPEKQGEADGPLTYRIEKRQMTRPTWEPISASLTIKGESKPLLELKTNRNMLAINSDSTVNGGFTASVVYVGRGTPAELEGKDLQGKILFGEGSIGRLADLAGQKGGAGVLAYNLPAYTQPEKHPNSIQFSSVSGRAKVVAFLLSYQAKERLKAALAKGEVSVNMMAKARSYPSEELTIVANVRGNVKPAERFVFSAHVQEPGANDNASGVGALAEMANVTAQLVKSGKLKPMRTLTFLWGDEIVSTRRYITDDAERAKGIKWGMSLDMVGEDTEKTGGTFLIEKMKDPSAVWTRGDDKHTEWGASEVKENDLFPHYFNDFVINRCKEQGKFANWVVNSNPYEGGSDHTPFLNAKIPGLLMWHFTDVYYHTDGDRIENVSKTTLKNVGVSALVTAYTLVSADAVTAGAIGDEIVEAAKSRLETELKLSKAAVKGGRALADEQHIVEAWWMWYDKALDTTNDLQTGGSSGDVKAGIAAKKKSLKDFYDALNWN
ncbi:M28 family peptidase [Hufsiella ginkgonis]|uniref:M28 family peptidase n=1 Tax=Hufsiella ginkgonis TaxID=2695274 RepID=A0A7K1XUR7_9SPHI|nr:M28 family peptidase [Hufsiella ginkgonis]MXV14753.1 M28 family peptidase [Hufsiella ginkgonis]